MLAPPGEILDPPLVSVSVSVSVTEWVRKVFRKHYANANGYGKPSVPIPSLKQIQKLKQIRDVFLHTLITRYVKLDML